MNKKGVGEGRQAGAMIEEASTTARRRRDGTLFPSLSVEVLLSDIFSFHQSQTSTELTTPRSLFSLFSSNFITGTRSPLLAWLALPGVVVGQV